MMIVAMMLAAEDLPQAPAPEQQQTATPPVATGTPTAATATVSPTTVAALADGPDSSGGPFDLSLGTSIATGDFGAGEDTRILSTAIGLRYATGNIRLSVSVPYLNIRSRGIVFSGIDSTPIIVAGAKPGAPRVTSDGIGDLTLGAAYTQPQTDRVPEIELSARVKLPTASNDGLSTGRTDFSAGVQITRTIGIIAPFASATYRVFGNPSAIELLDGFAASAGLSVGLGSRSVAVFSYHYAAAASRLVNNSDELFAGLSTSLPHSRFRLTAFATAGLSSGAAAASGGLSASLHL